MGGAQYSNKEAANYRTVSMKQKIVILVTIFLTSFLLGQQTFAKKPASDVGQKCEPVDTSQLSCQMVGMDRISIVGGEKVNGRISEFRCNGKVIELASESIDDSYIRTKRYGNIKIDLRGNFTFGFCLTPKQKHDLLQDVGPK
jgi:hypothetical protein